MIQCPNATIQTPDKVRCLLFPDTKLRSKTQSCNKCTTEWIDNSPPTPSSLTPTLVQIRLGEIPPETKPPKQLQEYPTLWQQAKNLANAVVEHAIDGLAKASAEEIVKRRNICNSCEQFDKEEDRCRSCGCALSVKISWASSSCPLNKWQRENKSGGCGCSK